MTDSSSVSCIQVLEPQSMKNCRLLAARRDKHREIYSVDQSAAKSISALYLHRRNIMVRPARGQCFLLEADNRACIDMRENKTSRPAYNRSRRRLVLFQVHHDKLASIALSMASITPKTTRKVESASNRWLLLSCAQKPRQRNPALSK